MTPTPTFNVPALLLSDYANLVVHSNNLYAIHLNLVSGVFLPFHQWSDEMRAINLELGDQLAERLRGINLFPATTLENLFKSKTIPEIVFPVPDQQALAVLLESTLQARAQLVQTAQLLSEDLGTQEILISVEKHYAKIIWMLNSSAITVRSVTNAQ